MAELKFEGARVVGTEEGRAFVAGSEQLVDVLGTFCDTRYGSEENLNAFPPIGTGQHSKVSLVDGLAVKISTSATGRGGSYEHAGHDYPENLIRQHFFLRALSNSLGNGADIVVPDQYVAVRAQGGRYLSVQEYMAGWQPLEKWAKQDTQAEDDEFFLHAVDHIRRRVKARIRDPFLRVGIDDLRFSHPMRRRYNNVLVPAQATQIEGTPICIIDQPGFGVFSSVALAGLRLTRCLGPS